ncbi:hypothetical protein GGH91_000981 [Coemansia sp. RSA 2671]|nr:hypothetical protein GGH91_000981 [Coemansia sp. RSA 2671]
MSELNRDAFAHTAAAVNALPLAANELHAGQPSSRGKSDSTEGGRRGRGRGRGRGGGRGGKHHSPTEIPHGSPAQASPPTSHGDFDEDGVTKIEDLESRGAVTRIGEHTYQIPGDLLSSGRSSITIGAAIGGDKRRFNLKWLYDYRWLRFDPGENSMLCALCKGGRRANQFAKLGSKNFKTSALVDHASSNDHKRSMADLGPSHPGALDPAYVALTLLDGVWVAQPLSGLSGPSSIVNQPPGSSDAAHVEDTCGEPQSAVSAIKSSPVAASVGAAPFEVAVGQRTVAQQSTSANSYSTVDTLSSAASRATPIEMQSAYVMPKSEHQTVRAARPRAGSSGPLVGTLGQMGDSRAPRSSATPVVAAPDERYAKEFEHAVQALLQAMNLNLPISSVADLYQLQTQHMPLADIGSRGHSSRFSNSSRRSDAVRLAGAYTNSTEAARTLQHVVSSELLSLIKDEVSQSPAFSVIIDEAPLREHNSLVAHVLLYLRYMRRDPESETGELQAITRFWRCVHLYYEDNGRLARRDPISLVLTLLERAKIDSSRLVCISCERPATHEDAEAERRRHPHVIHWHGIFTYPNSLSPQVYEEITNRSEDFVHFSMTLMDLCLFMYSHPTSFAFLGVDFQEMLYKTLYEIFLDEGSISTRLPISLTPTIVIALTRNISQIMATVLALSRVSAQPAAAASRTADTAGVNMPDHRGGDATTPVVNLTPKSPRSSLQIPLPIVDILVSSFGGRLGAQKSVGRCPPADALLERLRDYSFLGCLHFMADILLQIKPIIDIAGRSDMPTRVLGELSEPADHTLDQRLRAYIGTIRDVIESVTLMYGEEEGEDDNGFGFAEGGNEDEFLGFHLNEFMHLTDKEDSVCHFRSFTVVNYSREDSQSRLIELIRTVSSAILHDLHQRFNAEDIATIQALADMWDPTQFPREPSANAVFANKQTMELTERMSSACGADGLRLVVPKGDLASTGHGTPPVLLEWGVFKAEVRQQAEVGLGDLADLPATTRYVPGKIQLAYRAKLFPDGALAQSGRRLRSVEDSQVRANLSTLTADQSLLERLQRHHHGSYAVQPSEAWTKFGHLAKLATAWNVLPLALSTDLHFFRRFYERQLARICREQAENKLQSINFDIGDTFSELLGRLSSPHKKKRVTVYDLLQNSKVEVEQKIGSLEKPMLELELSGVTVDYFVRSIDAVTMALDHRLRLLSLEFTESPIAVSKTPGDCPKWMQNAMRGYWKLACRPPKPQKVPVVAPSVSHGLRHRTHTVSNPSAAGSGIAPWSTCTTSQTLDHPEPESLQPSAKRSRPLVSGNASALATASPVPLMPVLNSGLQSAQTSVFKTGTSFVPSSSSAIRTATGQQLPISSAVCATIQPAASDDLSTLPLLEALLSDPTKVPVPPPPPPPHVPPPPVLPPPPRNLGVKRSLDVDPPAMNYVVGEPGGKQGEAAMMMAAVAAAAGNKRMRHSADGVAMPPADPYGYDNSRFGGYQQREFGDAGAVFHPQRATGAKEGESFGTTIARLASDMGLDSASTQAFAASLSNQLMPPASSAHMEGVHATMMAAGIQQQQHGQPASYHGYSQQPLQQQYQAHRPGSAASLPGLVGAEGVNLQHNYAAAQLVFASQAAALNIHGFAGPVAGGPQGGMHGVTPNGVASFDQMIQGQRRLHMSREQELAHPFDYRLQGYLPDNKH